MFWPVSTCPLMTPTDIGNGGTTGSLATSSAITDNGALVFKRSDTVTQGTHFSAAAITGNGSLTQAGTGMLVLSAANTYTGATAVNAGTLKVTGSIGNSAVTVSNSGTVLASGTTGTIGNSVAVNNGAILAPGNVNAVGTATVTTATTFNDGSIFSWDISGDGAGYDKLVSATVVDGGTTGASIFRIVAADASFSNPFWNTGTKTWTNLFTQDGTTAVSNWAAVFSSVTVVNSSLDPITPAGGSFSLAGNTLTWTTVPEPTPALAGLLLCAGLLRRSRRPG